jgi:hypothetical protein
MLHTCKSGPDIRNQKSIQAAQQVVEELYGIARDQDKTCHDQDGVLLAAGPLAMLHSLRDLLDLPQLPPCVSKKGEESSLLTDSALQDGGEYFLG